ncbi:MAG: hypothetical protein ABIP06_06470 [Pyrinomonadaceae bacterium]
MKTAIILASGPSLTQEQIDAALHSGHFTIAVNATYQKAPTANVCYFGDFLFAKTYIADMRKVFKGEMWTQDATTNGRWPDVKRMRGGHREGLGKDVIHTNGQSGAQAINLAYLWGYKRIILLGFDLKLGPKGEKHHHENHPAPCVQGQTFSEWLDKFVKLAADLKAEGIEVLNATPGSALKSFPMVDWKEVLL